MCVLPKLIYPFYQQIAHLPRFTLIAVGSNIVNLSTFAAANITYMLLYKLEIPFFEKFKASKDPWHWKTDPAGFRSMFTKRTVPLAALNLLVILPLLFALPPYFDLDEKTTAIEAYPSTLEIAIQLIFFMLVEDTAFYWSHRMLHSKFFYSKIHKIHHEYHSSIGISVYHVHPLEFIFGNALTSSFGPIILGKRCHLVTYWLWVVVRVSEGADGHCGYEFPWSPFRIFPLSASSEFHNFHHSHNVGNYCLLYTSDAADE